MEDRYIPVIPLSRAILSVPFITVCIGGGGDRESHQQFAGRGNCSSLGLYLFLFSSRPISLLTISFFFGDWLMLYSRFSLGHSLGYKSLLDTWKHSLVRLQLAWNSKRITASGSDPEREHYFCVRICWSLHLPLCVLDLFPSGRYKMKQ